MPSNYNLNIKYGNKNSTGSQIKDETGAAIASAPGTIYAAENNTGNIEMYIDTPRNNNSARKRLDPRIFVGGVPTGKTVADIWKDYDVWIDTTEDPTGLANRTHDGLMSKQYVQSLEDLSSNVSNLSNNVNTTFTSLSTALGSFKLRIVDQTTWDTIKTNTANTADVLTVVLPTSAGTVNTLFNPSNWTISTSASNPRPANEITEGFGDDGGSGS